MTEREREREQEIVNKDIQQKKWLRKEILEDFWMRLNLHKIYPYLYF